MILPSTGIFTLLMIDKCLDQGGSYSGILCKGATVEPTNIELIFSITIGYFIATLIRLCLLKTITFTKSENKNVFVLQYSYGLNNCEETKMIGVFHTQSEAEKVVDKFKGLPGFKEHQDAFFIDQYELNFAHWDTGFFTYYYDDKNEQTNEKE